MVIFKHCSLCSLPLKLSSIFRRLRLRPPPPKNMVICWFKKATAKAKAAKNIKASVLEISPLPPPPPQQPPLEALT